jgi:hypothetical protein
MPRKRLFVTDAILFGTTQLMMTAHQILKANPKVLKFYLVIRLEAFWILANVTEISQRIGHSKVTV